MLLYNALFWFKPDQNGGVEHSPCWGICYVGLFGIWGQSSWTSGAKIRWITHFNPSHPKEVN